jgi:hypothetical protein
MREDAPRLCRGYLQTRSSENFLYDLFSKYRRVCWSWALFWPRAHFEAVWMHETTGLTRPAFPSKCVGSIFVVKLENNRVVTV